MIKYADPPVHAFCRARGALVILDNVDNYRGFESKHVNGTLYQSTDAVLVQTRWHAEWFARKYGLRAIVLPHPHGNLNGWNVMPRVRPRALGLGLLLGDAWRNQPPKPDLEAFTAVACAAGLRMTIVDSPPGRGISYRYKPCPNASSGSRALREAWSREHRRGARGERGERRPAWLGADDPMAALSQEMKACAAPPASAVASLRTRFCASSQAALEGAFVARALGTRFPVEGIAHQARAKGLVDVTHQKQYYEEPRPPTPSLHDTVDIGILWKPGNQMGGQLAIRNRPPTRMHWWWSHGIPTLG